MKKRTFYYLLINLIILVIISACDNGFDDCHNTINITNNSNKEIYAVTTLKKDFFNFDPTREDYASDYKLKSGETNDAKIGIKLQCWEQTLEQTGGYVYIYIYEAEHLEHPDNEWVVTQKDYIKMYSLNVKDLGRVNWEVKYP